VHNAAATTEYRVKTLSLGGSEAYKWLAALGGLAAAVVIAIGLYQTVPRADDPVVAASPDDRFASGSNSAALQVDVDKLDIEAFLRRQEQSARLATSARLLAAAPVDPQDAERARRYLREAYGIEQSSTMTSHANEL
jgi:hypothetical protein